MRRWMVKLLLIFFICLALLVIFANLILEKVATSSKGEVEALLSDSLNAKVSIASVTAQLNPFPQMSAYSVEIRGWAGDVETVVISQMSLRIELLPLFSHKLVINDIAASIPALNLATKHGAFKLRDLEIGAGLKLEQGQLELSDPQISLMINDRALRLSGRAISYKANAGELELSQLSLNFAQHKGALASDSNQLDLSGALNVPEQKIDLTLKIRSLYATSLAELISPLLPPSTSTVAGGVLSGTSTCSGKLDGELKFESSLNFKDISYADAFSLKSAEFKELKLVLLKEELHAASSTIDLVNLRVKESENRYQASKVKGKLEFGRSKAQASAISGSLNLVGFAFSDNATDISESDATIEPLNVKFEKGGSVSAELVLNGTRHKLKHEAIQIEGVKQVKATLAIKVPKGSGYSISGPVTVTDAEIQTIGHRFKNTSGTVEMLVSTPLKSFESKALTFVEAERPGKLAANFRMLPERYELVSAESNHFAGSVTLKASMERGATKNFSIDASAKELDLNRLITFVAPASNSEMQGKLDVPALSLKGQRNDFPNSLSGNAEAKMLQTKISPRSIGTKILGALRAVPVVGGIFGSEPANFEREVQSVDAKMRVQDGLLYIDSAKLSRPSYNVDLSGTLAFDKNINLRGDVIVLEESASRLGLNIGPLKHLFGRLGRIVVPIFVRGKVPDVEVEADIKTFVKNNAGIGLGKQIIRGLTGGSEKATPSPTP